MVVVSVMGESICGAPSSYLSDNVVKVCIWVVLGLLASSCIIFNGQDLSMFMSFGMWDFSVSFNVCVF